jgi:hypothetical protein
LTAVPPTEGTELERALAALDQRVAAKRAAGEYPPGLEQQLERHFAELIRELREPALDLGPLRSAVGRTHAHAFRPDQISHSSRLPVGTAVHATVAKAVSRQTIGVLQQSQDFADAVKEALTRVVEALEARDRRDRREVRDALNAVVDRLSVLDELVDRVGALERELAERERGAASAPTDAGAVAG